MRLPVNHRLTLAALLLAGVSAPADARAPSAPAEPVGPAADYPVIVGEPFTIGTTTWTPVNQLNYDAVGQASLQEGLIGIAGAHKTLPLPSYVEVTALDTGHTILVRLVERGPMDNATLIALSPQAAAQLGFAPGARAAVRVRRVNPPEVERAALRTGNTAPRRMDTPDSLLKVLRRKLAEQSPLAPPPSTPPKMPAITAIEPDAALPRPPGIAASVAKPAPSSAPVAKAPPAAAAPAPKASARTPAVAALAPAPASTSKQAAPAPSTPAKGATVVQVATFSNGDSARQVAAKLGGQVRQAGRFWRVRLGPFKSSGEAAPALEKARAAGYRDARIQRAN